MSNILLIGRGTIAVNGAELLSRRGYKPKVIVCDTDDTGTDSWTKSLYKYAVVSGYADGSTVFRQRSVNKPEFLTMLKDRFPGLDLILSLQPLCIFRLPFIGLAKRGVVNLHFAPLPKLRGVSPCSWIFLDGLETGGVTLHRIEDEGIDNGPVIARQLFPIGPQDSAWTVFQTCVRTGTDLLGKTLDRILAYDLAGLPQDEQAATYHPLHQLDFSKTDVDLTQPAGKILAFIKALTFPPYQMPTILVNGISTRIIRVEKIVPLAHPVGSPFVSITEGKLYITAIDGVIIIDKFTQG